MKTLKGTLSDTKTLRENLKKIRDYAIGGGDGYEIGILLSLILKDDTEDVCLLAKGYVYKKNKQPTNEPGQSEAQKLIEKLSAMLE